MKLWWSLAAYAVLAGAAWMTLGDMRIRLATLAVLAGIAVKTWLHGKRERPSQEIEPM